MKGGEKWEKVRDVEVGLGRRVCHVELDSNLWAEVGTRLPDV